eukprot:jgi/Bigna1/128654/aug1.7_g3362
MHSFALRRRRKKSTKMTVEVDDGQANGAQHEDDMKVERKEVSDLRKQRMKFHKKKASQQDRRKELTKRIKQIQKEFEDRCKEELEEYDAKILKGGDEKEVKADHDDDQKMMDNTTAK